MISSQLQSQTISRRFVISLLYQKGKTFDAHKVRFEAWHIGLWTNYGIISWSEVALFLEFEATEKANPYGSNLNVISKGVNLFLVESSQGGDYYGVIRNNRKLTCNCMKFKCWNNRMKSECPQLYKALGEQIFCHYTKAVERFLNQSQVA